jgi:hypothetical protein
MNETDALIEKIKKWKADKDEVAYQAKVVEENATYLLMEEINSTIVPEAQDILKVFITLKKCGVSFSEPTYIHIYNSIGQYDFFIDIPFGSCRGFIKPTGDMYFKKVDSNGYLTRETSNPPSSKLLEQFIKDFKGFKKAFYDFVDKTLKN